MNTALLVILIIVGFITGYLAVIIFSPILSVRDQIIRKETYDKSLPGCRYDITIAINDTFLSAWLYLPDNISRPVPCVILSTGFGGTKDVLLESYALRFVENGLAAITYDYRYFGASGGEPRQLFNGIKQQEDLRTAINYAREHEQIDSDSIILWSVSAAGRYGINAASVDSKIAGVITQCPSLDHAMDDRLIFQREGIWFFIKLFMHAQRDKGRSRFGLSPHYVPIVGKPHTMALMTAPGALEGYENLIVVSKYFVNGICARSLLMLQGPDVIKTAHNVKCQVLIIVAEHDTTVSPDSYKRVAGILGDNATIIKFPVGHFDLYTGEFFEKAINAQLNFIKKIIAQH